MHLRKTEIMFINSKIADLSIIDCSNRPGLMRASLQYNGKRKTVYGRKKAEIKGKAREWLEQEIAMEESHKFENQTLNAYISEYLQIHKQNVLSPSSYSRVLCVYHNYIKDRPIGSKLLRNVTANEIQEEINRYAVPATSDVRPLALSTVKKIDHLYYEVMKQAYLENRTNGIPVYKLITIPSEEKCIVKTAVRRSMNRSEIDLFLSTALMHTKDESVLYSRNAAASALLLTTGMRAGELCGLKWEDIDFTGQLGEYGEIYVHRTYISDIREYDDDNKIQYSSYLKDGTKTKAGKRKIPITNETMYILNCLKKYDRVKGLDSEFVFCTTRTDGHGIGIQTVRNLEKSVKQICDKNNIKDITPHCLRHTYITENIKRGLPIWIVSMVAGHSRSHYAESITEKVYFHTDEADIAAFKFKNIGSLYYDIE